MSRNRFTKDPDAHLNYTIDWSEWLVTDTISTSTWTVPTGITKDSDTNSTTTTTIKLSGGTVGEKYEIVNHVVTAAALEDDRTIVITIREK